VKEPTPKIARKSNGLVVTVKITAALAVTSAIIYVAYMTLTNPFFKVSDLDIQLASEASQNILFAKIKDSLDTRLKSVKGQYVWQVDISDILGKVEKDLRVKDAKVTRVLPNKILISIIPHTAVGSVMGPSSDKLYPIARDGEVLPSVDVTESPDGPILRGEIFLQDELVRREALKLLLALPEKGSLSPQQISELHYDKKHGFSLVVSPGGTEVWMGFDDFTRHGSQAQRVLDYLINQRLTGRIIDARLGKKVVVKLRNQP
jgi:cell division septal protein FtsQ